MAMPRFLSPQSLIGVDRVELDAVAARHAQVLRLNVGDSVQVFDGVGTERTACVVALGRQRLALELGAVLPGNPESPLGITLVQCVSKGERMDWTIQKAVELGVAAIRPVFSRRSVVRLEGSRLDRRIAHWEGVIRGACEQSGRRLLPDLLPPLGLDRYLDADENHQHDSLRLLLAPTASQRLQTVSPPDAGVILLVGPEGGLATDEVQAAVAAGFETIGLGPRVLRTETAGIAGLAVLQALWGDLC